MEQRIGQDDEDLFKTNIELKVKVEGLKKELIDKQELPKKCLVIRGMACNDLQQSPRLRKLLTGIKGFQMVRALESISSQHHTELGKILKKRQSISLHKAEEEQIRELEGLLENKQQMSVNFEDSYHSLVGSVRSRLSAYERKLKEAIAEKDELIAELDKIENLRSQDSSQNVRQLAIIADLAYRLSKMEEQNEKKDEENNQLRNQIKSQQKVIEYALEEKEAMMQGLTAALAGDSGLQTGASLERARAAERMDASGY